MPRAAPRGAAAGAGAAERKKPSILVLSFKFHATQSAGVRLFNVYAVCIGKQYRTSECRFVCMAAAARGRIGSPTGFDVGHGRSTNGRTKMANADPRSAAALRLDAAGLTPPLPVLLLHGWSPGPGLPGSLLASGLFTVHEIEASTILTIATNRYALALVGLLCGTFVLIANVAGNVWYAWLALLPAIFGSWQLKKMAVGFTLDKDIEAASLAIARIRPAAVVGYSWGGGIAECCIESGIWAGPTLLLAPCGALLCGHAGRAAPTLSRLRSGVDGTGSASTGVSEANVLRKQPVVTLIHGEADAIVPVEDSYALARSGADGVCELVVGRDDHFLWRLCNAGNLLDVLVRMIAGSDGNQIN